MRSAVPLLLLLAAGCATAKSPWHPTEGPYVALKAGFELQPPPGWMRLDPKEGEEVYIGTRDGFTLQRIVAGSTEFGKPLPFATGKRPVVAGMSPAELAELVVDSLSAAESVSDLRTLENRPASLAGREGFHVLASFRIDGLARRASVCGLTEGNRFYWLFYVAPERRYFALDIETFDHLLRSFSLRAPAAAPPRATAPPAS